MSYNTKEMRTRLKAEVKTMMAKGVELRERRKACGAAGDQCGANDARLEQVYDYRPDARALFIAYAFIKGRTYRQAEAKHDEGNEPYGYLTPLRGWEGDDTLVGDWIEAGDRTRVEIEARERHKLAVIQLHQLIRKDQDEGGLADDLRETLADTWEDLAPEDQETLNNLSGDLYETKDQELFAMAPSVFLPTQTPKAPKGLLGRLRAAAGV